MLVFKQILDGSARAYVTSAHVLSKSDLVKTTLEEYEQDGEILVGRFFTNEVSDEMLRNRTAQVNAHYQKLLDEMEVSEKA